MIAKFAERIAQAEHDLRLAKSKVRELRNECSSRENFLLSFLSSVSTPRVSAKMRKWLAICEKCNRTKIFDGRDEDAIVEQIVSGEWLIDEADGGELWLPGDLAFRFFCPTCAMLLPERRDKNTWRK